MKLVFKKDEEHLISVFQEVDGKQLSFSYVDMIKALIKSKQLDEPEISEGFTDAETKSIKSMVTLINKEVSAIIDHDLTPES
jgi:methionine synthase II (cobalamin-independent)